MHHRMRPVSHAFRYRVFYLRLPLSQLNSLPDCGLARGRWRLLSFDSRDHGPRDGTDLTTWVRDVLAHAGLPPCDGEIVLQTFPRMLGYVFNPISQWFVFDHEQALRAVICEVNNTFGERHHYLVAHPDGRAIANDDILTARKLLHVSPFCEVKGHYRFRFCHRQGRWTSIIDYHDGQTTPDRLLSTLITGTPRPLSTRSLLSAFLRYPLFTLGVITRIHWQAFRLWRKRVPWFAKPHPPIDTVT